MKRQLPGWLAAGVLGTLVAGCGSGDSIRGSWQADVFNAEGEPVSFVLEIGGRGGEVTGAVVQGADRIPATSGRLEGNRLTLEFDYYDARLEATVADGSLEGAFTRQRRRQILTRRMRASRTAANPPAPPAEAPDLSGDWLLTVEGPEGTERMGARLAQRGAQLEGTVIPVSGDWGLMTGSFDGRSLRLGRFDVIRTLLWTAELAPDGALVGRFDLKTRVVARRRQPGDPAPFDPDSYTRVRDPKERFQFRGQDLDGRTVTERDPRFHDKVVLVNIMGSWCPNCHDEAPFLNALYERYREQGLEIVGLAYEYTGDAERDMVLVRRFRDKHGVRYPLLLAGSTEEGEIERTLPQLVNFGAYPTTVFLGRDGRVARIHAGFEGPATGGRFEELKEETELFVRRLLAAAVGT